LKIDRSTGTGKLISSYLSDSSVVLPDQSIHLLFSANRWETASRINALLNAGTNVILDRYVPSGIVFSVAKEPSPFDITWAMAPEIGLPAPDLVIFLDIDEGAAAARGGGYGEERYEKREMQRRVRSLFLNLAPTWSKIIGEWQTLDAAQELETVTGAILTLIQNTAASSSSQEIKRINRLSG
jgi:dTMP kinase